MFARLQQAGFPLLGAVLAFTLGPLALWLSARPLAGVSGDVVDLGRAGLCVAVVVILLLLWARFWKGAGARAAAWAVVGLSLLCACAAVSTVDSSLRRHLGTPRQVSTWNFFHYYLGSKYFAELGYDGLYEEALKADQQGQKRFRHARHYRDMKTYGMKPSAKVRKAPRRDEWSGARWKEFKRDVATIGGLESRRFWADPLRDRGYNPPPGWTLLGGTLAKLTDPRHPLESALLMCVDPGLLLLAFALSVRTYGLFRSALALLGMALWVGSYRLFGGKLVQYDWLAALWASLCCMRRERFVWAGIFAAYATSVRLFPGGVMLGALACALFQIQRERRVPSSSLQLFGAGTLALGVLVVAGGLASGRGLAAWAEFAEKSAIHQFEHKFSESRIGLPYLTTASPESGIDARVRRSVREENYEDNRLLRWTVQLCLVGLLLLAARRSDLHDGAILGLALVFALAVSSRYYGAMYGLLLLRGALAAPRAPPVAPPLRGFTGALPRALWHRLVAAGSHVQVRWLDVAFFVALALSYVPVLVGADSRTIYMLGNGVLLVYLVAVLVVQARGAGGSGARLRESPARAARTPSSALA